MTVVGRVAGLWRYPVKSMAAEELDGAEFSWHGLAGDRRWAFIRDGQVRSGFPWLTIREQPEMARYRPRFAEPGPAQRLTDAGAHVVRPANSTWQTPRSRPNSAGVGVIKQDQRGLRHHAVVVADHPGPGWLWPAGAPPGGQGSSEPTSS